MFKGWQIATIKDHVYFEEKYPSALGWKDWAGKTYLIWSPEIKRNSVFFANSSSIRAETDQDGKTILGSAKGLILASDVKIIFPAKEEIVAEYMDIYRK